MAFLTGLLLIALLSLDWAKNCKAVNYEFKQFGVKKYGYGCKKGCVGYANDSTGVNNGTKEDGDHYKQEKCVECKTITKDLLKSLSSGEVTDEEVEETCNSFSSGTCFWNSKKKTCGAGSCPHKAAYESCSVWKNGKCEKPKDDDCKVSYYWDNEDPRFSSGPSTVVNCDGTPLPLESDGSRGRVLCTKLADYCHQVGYSNPSYVKYTSDNAKECKYECDHPEKTDYQIRTYEYTKDERKKCHKVFGCMYSESGDSYCSALAIWAFILILVIAILVVIAIIALIIFIILKLCGSKTSQVNPDNSKDASQSAAASEDGAVSDKAIHDQPVEGPYVVIKMGDKQLSTKKVAKAPVLVWGETVVFDTLGNEDEDATFELCGTDSDGTHTLRILDYVNNKQRVPLTLKNSAGADVGVLEVDIEIKAQEDPVKVSGIFFIDKYGPGGVGKE